MDKFSINNIFASQLPINRTSNFACQCLYRETIPGKGQAKCLPGEHIPMKVKILIKRALTNYLVL